VRAESVALTLRALAAWQSLCTGTCILCHHWKNSVALAFTDGDRPSVGSRYFCQPCVGALGLPNATAGQRVTRTDAEAITFL